MPTYLQPIEQVLRKNQIDGLVVVTFATFETQETVQKWILGLEKLQFKKFAIICVDKRSHGFLKSAGYTKNIALMPNEWLDFNSKANFWYHLLAANRTLLYSDPRVLWINKNVLTHVKTYYRNSHSNVIFAQELGF